MKILADKYCQGCGAYDTLFEISLDRFRCVECVKIESPEKFAEIYIHMKEAVR